MTNRDLTVEFEFRLYEVPEQFKVTPIILPEGEDIRYALLDKKNELYDATGLRELLKKTSFAKSPDFTFYMIVEGKRGYITVPLPEWPVTMGFGIVESRVMVTPKVG